MAISLHVKDPAKQASIPGNFSGPIKTYDQEAEDYIPSPQVPQVEEQETVDLESMNKQEIDEYIENKYNVKIDRRKFRSLEKLKEEAHRIIETFNL